MCCRLEENEAGDSAPGRSLPKLKNPTTLSIIREHGEVKVHFNYEAFKILFDILYMHVTWAIREDYYGDMFTRMHVHVCT